MLGHAAIAETALADVGGVLLDATSWYIRDKW